MSFQQSLEEGYVKKVPPNTLRAKSLLLSGKQAISSAQKFPFERDTLKSILRELYEGLRQYCEAVGYQKGYKFSSHESITFFLNDVLGDATAASRFDRYRKLRNGINYYGDEIASETVQEALQEITQLTKRLEQIFWKIKAIIFDLDGVYFPKGTEEFPVNLAKKYHLPLEKVMEVYRSKLRVDFYAGRMSHQEFWQTFAKRLGITATEQEFLEIFLSGYTIDIKIAELVRIVRKRFKTVIFTYNFKERIEMLDEKYHFLRDFDIVVLSYEVGSYKPDPKMGKALLERTGCRPEEILVIDDGKRIIEEMQQEGFQAIWYQDYEGLVDELKRRKVV